MSLLSILVQILKSIYFKSSLKILLGIRQFITCYVNSFSFLSFKVWTISLSAKTQEELLISQSQDGLCVQYTGKVKNCRIHSCCLVL